MNNFKKYQSYISRIVVEETSSQYNEKLIVAIQNGKYVLNAKNANYSFATLHKVFQQALKKVKLTEKQRVLVLGCGAGSIPSIIYKEKGLTPTIDAVEIDQKVVDLGIKYFGLNQYEKLTIIIGNALNFVKTANSKYDLICVDVFNGINVPNEFLIPQFFEQLKNLLSENGEILLNFVAYNYETKQKAEQIEKEMGTIFSGTKVYRLEDINRIFYATKKE